MPKNGVDQKPSKSALIAALRRTIAHQEYPDSPFGPDHLAVLFLPPHFRFFLKFNKIRANTKAKLDALFPGMTEFIIARTAYFDDLFVAALKGDIPQIVLLGAGYDSRAYRFSKINNHTKIYELDIEPTQYRKKKCLKNAKIEKSANVAFVPIDFNRDSLKNVLENAGWRPDQKTLFLWEGVTYYLDPGAVDAVLEFFNRDTRPDSLFAFDYSISLTENNIHEYYGAAQFVQSMREHQANEELTFSIGEGKIEAFLEGSNLKIVEHLDNQEIESKYLTDDKGALLGRIPAHLRFVLVTQRSM